MLWRDAVLDGLHRFSAQHNTRLIDRQRFITEQLDRIVRDAESQGQTPDQTLSRVLQELRDDNLLFFTGNGKYLLADGAIENEKEDLPEDAIDFAVKNKKLILGDVPVGERLGAARQRKGQDRVRALALDDYDHRCALCEIAVSSFLVASHIVRWKDDVMQRGNLSNVLCLCRLHDPLFEAGYFAISDEYDIVKKRNVPGQVVIAVLELTNQLRLPRTNKPAPEFLRKHRIRTGFEMS